MALEEAEISAALGCIRTSADFFGQCAPEIQEQCLDELHAAHHAAQKLQTALEKARLGSARAGATSAAHRLRKEVAETRTPSLRMRLQNVCFEAPRD